MKRNLKILKVLSLFIVILIIIRICIGEIGMIPSSSMEPTLLAGDVLWIDKITYGARLPSRWSNIPVINSFTWIPALRKRDKSVDWGYHRVTGIRKPKKNDVIIFNRKKNEQTLIVKRITHILNSGDTIHVGAGNYMLYKDIVESEGKTLYKRGQNIFIDDRKDSIYVLSGNHYYVEGDNKLNSYDSRSFGYIPEYNITGKAYSILYSIDNYKIRFNRFFQKVR